MLLRLCQFKILSLILLLGTSSCSWWHKSDYKEKDFSRNKWFNVNEGHSIRDAEGNPELHLFFDINPDIRQHEQLANVVILNPANSPYAFALNLSSGQRFFSHAHCKQKDIWHERSGTFDKPSYSVAILPRSLDQLGEPQKVLVFGKEHLSQADKNSATVKFVGAYVEQTCPEGNCSTRGNWLSRLVFIAVDPSDYPEVSDTQSFEKKFPWKDIAAQIENVDGRNGFEGRSFPALRAGKLIAFTEAFDYFSKRSLQFSPAELSKIQNSCYALYDSFWSEVGDVREEEKPAKNAEELSAKLKLRAELKKRNIPVGFSTRLRIFVEKYHKDIYTCEKFVYHGNINKDSEKFWFLSYMGMFFRLHEEGYFFNCAQKTWMKNYISSEGKKTYDLKTDIDQCSTADIDRAMDYLGNFLKTLKHNSTTYYSFIDYDNHPFGTHQKIYSWLKRRNMSFECSEDPNPAYKKAFHVFPEDARWKHRDIQDVESDLKIIY
jgi:hypothetical protein